MVTTSEIPSSVASDGSSRSSRLWKGVDVFVMSLAIIAGVLLGAVGLLVPFGLAGGAQDPSAVRAMPVAYTLGVLAVQAIVMLGAVWLLGLMRRRYTWADIGLVPTTRGWIVTAIGIFFVLRIAATLVAALLAQLGLQSMQAQALAPGGFSWLGAIGTLLFAGVAVPIAEEVFFRGVVYRWLRDKWGVAVGAIVSSIAFGLAHLEPATVIPATLLGIALALVYERSKSLWPPILIHALNNTFAIALLYTLLAFNVPIPGVNQ